MPSEAEQSKLAQPWKEWHAKLDPMSRQDIHEGNVIMRAPAGDKGSMLATAPREVDLKAKKEIPLELT